MPKKASGRRPRRGSTGDRAAIAVGAERARSVIARRRRIPRLRAAPKGLLVAEGDSWFDYPFFDILDRLEDNHGYDVESVAHKGDTMEELVYDDSQLSKLARLLQKLAGSGKTPKAILLSGGGNDIAGTEFTVLLNHKRSSLPPVNAQVVDGLIESRLRAATIALVSAVTEFGRTWFGKTLPILMHGYDYPVPDGRGYLGGWWVLPGPWLAPGFRQKGYEALGERIEVMVDLIDRFNAMLRTVPGVAGLGHLRYVDLRGTLSNVPATYKKWWNDELHPTEPGFDKVAARFHQVLAALP
jgi:lysophospholipase L1-like esterase